MNILYNVLKGLKEYKKCYSHTMILNVSNVNGFQNCNSKVVKKFRDS